MKKKKILFIIHHRHDRSPGQRFRFEQYIPLLEAHGYTCDFSPLLPTEAEDKAFYSPSLLSKAGILLKTIHRRLHDARVAGKYDVIFLYREAFMTGSIYFERRFRKAGPRIVFDYDDSIWLSAKSDSNKALSFLKNPDKTRQLISMSDMVFAGNEYLADYARRFNNNVRIVPTTIDTEEYRRMPVDNKGRICIGWSGSFSTVQHFKHAIEPLKKIISLYGNRVYIKVIGDGNYQNKDLDIQGIPWRKDTEIKELSEIDIGIMPLPDDAWSRGKCGLKGLQYMALEIPTIMSPVGVNSNIISDGINGFLAANDEEWVEKLSRLIDDASLRKRVGEAGRKTVIDYYSVDANQQLYLRLFNELTA